MADQIRYDLLTQKALRGVVRNVLTDAAKKGLPGDHHFYIGFDTHAAGVRLSDRLRTQYPEQMTIILQHQYWDLAVSDTGFEVGLSFGGIPEKLTVPFEAISSFFDPSVQFGLQFEEVGEGQDPHTAPANVQDKGSRQATARAVPRAARRSRAARRPQWSQKPSPPRSPSRRRWRRSRAARPVPQEVTGRRRFRPRARGPTVGRHGQKIRQETRSKHPHRKRCLRAAGNSRRQILGRADRTLAA